MNKLRYIKDVILKNRYRYAAGILCLVIVDIMQLALPKILGTVTDLLKNHALTRELLSKYCIMLASIALGIGVFRFLWRYLVLGVSRKIEETLRNRFYQHLQKLSANYYNNHKTGDLMAHATNDINNITMTVGHGVAVAIDSALIPLVAVTMMFRTAGFKLTLAAFSPLFILVLLIISFLRQMNQRAQKMQEAFSNLTEMARENFSGVRVIKSFVQETKEIEKFKNANIKNKKANLKFIRLTSLLYPVIYSVAALSFVITLWYGGLQVINGHITLGDFISFNSYLIMLIWPMAALGWLTNIFQRGSVSFDRVNTILDEVPEIKDAPDAAAIKELEGKIEFRSLSFSYPGSSIPALKNINIQLDKGKTLAIVGRTGSGKSTLANLILRLYSVPDGSMFIDDTDICKIPLSVLRNGIGYVPQEPFMFSSTLAENIDFYNSSSMDSIIEASKIARVYDNIMDFPQKFDTPVGERGVTLSGGQKQRLAIARAVLRPPAILILDDCLSAVDANTEKEILKELRAIMQQRTSIIISHRISTIMDADEIIVLDDGEIAERGTHESLLSFNGIYSDMYKRQLLAEQLEEED